MQRKETAQMQLWTDEGYRNIWCSKCRKQSRCQDWRCRHDLVWNECPIHRQDPEQHRTIRSAQSLGKLAPPVTLLSSERPEPESKSRKQCRRKLNAAIKRKCVIQSTHPAFYNVGLSKCPKLAAKVIGFSLRQEPETGEDVCHSATLHSQCASRGVDDIPSIQRESVSPHSANGPSLPGTVRVDEDVRPTTEASCSVAAHVQFFNTAATGAACGTASCSGPVRL